MYVHKCILNTLTSAEVALNWSAVAALRNRKVQLGLMGTLFILYILQYISIY